MSAPLPGLRRERLRRNITQAQLAQMAGVSVSSVRTAEGALGDGSRLSLAVCNSIADALGVGIENLMGETPLIAFRRRREEVTDFLLQYRAVHYPTHRKTREG